VFDLLSPSTEHLCVLCVGTRHAMGRAWCVWDGCALLWVWGKAGELERFLLAVPHLPGT
jgi:hypothetical protein